MPAIVLMDNDAALKLARYDLLDSALSALKCAPAGVRVLHTAGYTLMPTKAPLRHCKNGASADRLDTFLKQAQPVDQVAVNSEWLDVLLAIPGIDPGEAILFAYCAGKPEAVIVTGDKRATRALCATREATEVLAALAGRVLCMETLFAGLVEQDFALTQTRVRENEEVDKALTAIFGVAAPATLASVLEGLDSYQNALRTQTGALLRASVSD